MNHIATLIAYMQDRLIQLEEIAEQGVIPGQLDSIELQQMIGRIKELKQIIAGAERLIEIHD